MLKLALRSLAIILCIYLSSCVNHYQSFYQDKLNGQPVTSLPMYEPTIGEPQVIIGKNIETDNIDMLENGFYSIGYSSFQAANATREAAIDQAKKVHAAAVVLYGKYSHTESGAIPVVISNPSQTVTTYHSGNISGSGGSATYTGASTSTVPGGSTTHLIPYSVNKFDYGATFWIKTRPPALGIFTDNLPPERKQELQRNTGVIVVAVVKNSPAFYANILRGDVVVKIGDTPVGDGKHFSSMSRDFLGQTVPIELIRGKEAKTITVRIGQGQ